MAETGFYALDTWGTDPARIAAVARHIPDAVVYVRGRSNIRNLFAYHNIPTVVPKCTDAPAGHTMTGRCLEHWLIDRNPDHLVVDAYAYGRQGELQRYIKAKGNTVSYLAVRDTSSVNTRDFRAVIKAEPVAGPGHDLYPLLSIEPPELPTRNESRRLLGASDRPVVLIIGEGSTPDFRGPTIRACQAHGVDHVVVSTYPVQPLMVGADLVVGYAGHSQFEAEAAGVPMLAVRNYRDPHRSAAGATLQDIQDAIAGLVVRPSVRARARRTGAENRARRTAALVSGDPDWRHVDG